MNQLTLKQIRIAILIFVIAMVAFSVPSIYNLITKQDKIAVEISTIPADATVAIDNKKSSNTVYLEPGSYTFTAIKEGFKRSDQTIIISEDNNQVALRLEPQSDEAKKWYEENVDDLELQKIGSIRIKSTSKSYAEKNPVLDFLPKTDITGPFKIDYGLLGEDTYDAYIIISYSTPDGRKKAFDYIRSNGIDPTTLDIRYKEGSFTNPLTGKGY